MHVHMYVRFVHGVLHITILHVYYFFYSTVYMTSYCIHVQYTCTIVIYLILIVTVSDGTCT